MRQGRNTQQANTGLGTTPRANAGRGLSGVAVWSVAVCITVSVPIRSLHAEPARGGDPAEYPHPEPEAAQPPATGTPYYDSGKSIGRGFHLLDEDYWLLGPNVQLSDEAVTELELSYVPFFSKELIWGGVFASGGFTRRDGVSDARYGGGVETGWRILAVDVGVLSAGDETRLRGRWGITLAHETFTESNARFGRYCDGRTAPSYTELECSRTPAGLSLFVYHALEHDLGRAFGEHWPGSFGFSLKIGVGQ